jgi:hypothetical protein
MSTSSSLGNLPRDLWIYLAVEFLPFVTLVRLRLLNSGLRQLLDRKILPMRSYRVDVSTLSSPCWASSELGGRIPTWASVANARFLTLCPGSRRLLVVSHSSPGWPRTQAASVSLHPLTLASVSDSTHLEPGHSGGGASAVRHLLEKGRRLLNPHADDTDLEMLAATDPHRTRLYVRRHDTLEVLDALDLRLLSTVPCRSFAGACCLAVDARGHAIVDQVVGQRDDHGDDSSGEVQLVVLATTVIPHQLAVITPSMLAYRTPKQVVIGEDGTLYILLASQSNCLSSALPIILRL